MYNCINKHKLNNRCVEASCRKKKLYNPTTVLILDFSRLFESILMSSKIMTVRSAQQF